MSSTPLSTVGITMPSDFPQTQYEAIQARVIARKPLDPNLFDQYQGGWNGVAYRFRACSEHDEAFTDSVNRLGITSLTFEERYKQEKELFGFFVSGLATLESTAYALFAVGAILDSVNFPMATTADLRKIGFKSTADKYNIAFPSETITALLGHVEASTEFKKWSEVRNVLAHRTAPGRAFKNSATISLTAGVVSPPTTTAEMKGLGIPLDVNTTTTRRAWLAKTLADILDAADLFTGARL